MKYTFSPQVNTIPFTEKHPNLNARLRLQKLIRNWRQRLQHCHLMSTLTSDLDTDISIVRRTLQCERCVQLIPKKKNNTI